MNYKSPHSSKHVTSGFLALAACWLLLAATPVAAQALTELGSDSWAIDPNAVGNLSYTQTSTNTSITTSIGGTIGGLFTDSPFDWSSVSQFGLLMSLNGTSPNQIFTIEFFNSNILESDPLLQVDYYVAQFEGVASGVANVVSLLALTKNDSWVPPSGGSGGLNDFSDIVGMQFTWSSTPEVGSTTTEATLVSIVPEPSTWALLGCGGALLGGLAWRRRLAAARR